MGDVRLSIFQKDPLSNNIDDTSLKNRLTELGLLGNPFDFYGEASFAPGKNFGELIKTDIEIEEDKKGKGFLSRLFRTKEETFPSIRITLETNSELVFDCSPEDLESVSCPNCKAEIDNWEEEIDNWFNDNNYTYECKACQTVTTPYNFDYQRLGAFSKQTINIWNIGKGSGEPTKKFLEELSKVGQTEFDFYFVRI